MSFISHLIHLHNIKFSNLAEIQSLETQLKTIVSDKRKSDEIIQQIGNEAKTMRDVNNLTYVKKELSFEIEVALSMPEMTIDFLRLSVSRDYIFLDPCIVDARANRKR